MSTKTIYKRIALVAVTALGAGVLSVAPANATGEETIVVTQSLDASLPLDASATATAKGQTGAQVTFLFTGDEDSEYTVVTDGKSSITSAAATVGAVKTAPTFSNSSSWAGGATWAPIGNDQTLTVKLTASAAGSSVVTVSEVAANGVSASVATLTVTWAAASSADLASLSAFIVANGDCAATITKSAFVSIPHTQASGSYDLCVVAKNNAGTAYTRDAVTISAIGNGIGSFNGPAVASGTTTTVGFWSADIAGNSLPGAGTFSVTGSATNADATTVTKTASASIAFRGTPTAITLSVKQLSVPANASTEAIEFTATDSKGQSTNLDFSGLTSIVKYVESDKGTVAVSATAPDNSSTSSLDDNGVDTTVAAATGVVTKGTLAVNSSSATGYEKLTIWVSGKNTAGATITSNKVVVYVSSATVKSLVIDATAAATGGMTYKVQALSDPATTGTAYPVVDGETVTFGASSGILAATSAVTDKTGAASVTFYPPALGSSVTLYASTGTGVTLVSASKVIANVVTSEISSLTTLVNSLIAKINALNKLVIKIQKKVRA